MTPADTFSPFQDRLLRLADQTLRRLEDLPVPTSALDIARVARAVIAVDRMIRGVCAPLTKPRAGRRGAPVAAGREYALSTSTGSAPASCTPLRGPLAEGEATMVPGAKSIDAPETGWQKGWAVKQAQMREQRAVRTGKWPDGSPYTKSG